MEKHIGRKIKVFRLDNSGEYNIDPFLQLCHDESIKIHFIVREAPQKNEMTKRMNQTLLENVRCMLSNSGLSQSFWAEALMYACHIINKLYSSAIGGKTLMEV